LAGQHSGYIAAQLKSFREGARANDPNGVMRAVASKMSEHDMRAVAEYAAGLR
jgi:cytochrome c553